MSWVFFAFILAYAHVRDPDRALGRPARRAQRAHAHRELVVGVHAADRRRVELRVAARHALPVRRRRSRRVPVHGARDVALDPAARARHRQGHLLRRRVRLSAAATTFAVTPLLPHFDWRRSSSRSACVGFVWADRVAPLVPRRSDRSSRPRTRPSGALILADRPADVPHPRGVAFWLHLLRQRNVLLLCLLYMPNCATFYFCITWLPTYLEKQHGFEKAELGVVAALPLVAERRHAIPRRLPLRPASAGDSASPRRAARRASSGYALAAVFILLASFATAARARRGVHLAGRRHAAC